MGEFIAVGVGESLRDWWDCGGVFVVGVVFVVGSGWLVVGALEVFGGSGSGL